MGRIAQEILLTLGLNEEQLFIPLSLQNWSTLRVSASMHLPILPISHS